MLWQFIQDPAGSAPLFITMVITLIVAFTIHEYSHALVATRLGDPTPSQAGRLTLNPLAHLDVFGTLMFLLAYFGWAKPVPVNPYQLSRKSHAGLMLVSLAGPASNFLMALIAVIPVRLGLASNYSLASFLPSPYFFLTEFIFFNLILTFFNLIPLAPLDGEKIAEYFFPPSWAKVLVSIRPYSMLILLLVFFILPYMGVDIAGRFIFTPIQRLAFLLIGT